MAKQPTPRVGELTTANYGWTKPTVGASADAWGGYINADLDGIDSVVFGKVAKAGDTMTGTLTVPNLVAPQAMGDNRIINGDMRIDQRNNGAAFTPTTTSAYTADRWAFFSTQGGKATITRYTAGAAGLAATGFGYQLGFEPPAAYPLLATDYFCLAQPVEADLIVDFLWGTANARPVTLSFWVQSNLTGTFSGAIQNYAETRAYPFTFSIPTANTWFKIIITIPGDTAGTWNLQGNSGGLYLLFDMGSGANYRAPANAWTNGNIIGANGAVSIIAISGSGFYLTGVKLEIGSVATPFNRQSLAKSMADCQRYYSTASIYNYVYVVGVQYFGYAAPLPVTMRAAPTITFTNMNYTNASGITLALGGALPFTQPIVATSAAAGIANFSGNMNASAEL